MNKEEYLKSLLFTETDIKKWLSGEGFPFGKYDGELGYLHRTRICREGEDNSLVEYTYDERTGSRGLVNYAGSPCRINTYGDSFTSCEQVNDGETWQEYLASHLREPVRNYGIGGYSVYQTYLRMVREERRSPADYIIFNIFDDDHRRNLVGWQRFIFTPSPKVLHPPQPYIEANPVGDVFHEFANPCPTPKSLSHLCDLDWVIGRFGDHLAMRLGLASKNIELGSFRDSIDDVRELCAEYGVRPEAGTRKGLSRAVRSIYVKAGIFATMQIVRKAEELASKTGKKMIYVLSYGSANLGEGLSKGVRFDQTLVDFMRKERLRCVDQMKAHRDDYSDFGVSVDRYLRRFYVLGNSFMGHYNPRGNFFQAQTIRSPLRDILDPPPASYQLSPKMWDECIGMEHSATPID